MYLPLNRFASPTGGLSGFLLKVYTGKVQIIFACSAGSDLSYNLYSCYNIHCIKLFSIQYFKKTFKSARSPNLRRTSLHTPTGVPHKTPFQT
jgi:hypothetical protein